MSFAVGQKVTAAALNLILNPPRFVGRGTSAQAIANATWTALTIDTEEIDSYAMHSTSVNTARVTPTVAGWYKLEGGVNIAPNATAQRAAAFVMNGSANHRYHKAQYPVSSATYGSALNISGRLYFNGSTDYVELQVVHSAGVSLNTVIAEDGAPGSNTRFAVTYDSESQT